MPTRRRRFVVGQPRCEMDEDLHRRLDDRKSVRLVCCWENARPDYGIRRCASSMRGDRFSVLRQPTASVVAVGVSRSNRQEEQLR